VYIRILLIAMDDEEFIFNDDLVNDTTSKPMKIKKEKIQKRKNMKKDDKKVYALKLIEELDQCNAVVDEKLQSIMASELGKLFSFLKLFYIITREFSSICTPGYLLAR
jgi:type II secretory pathway component HofQ